MDHSESPLTQRADFDPADFSEEERLGILEAHGLPALRDDPELSAITDFAARLCEAESAMVSLVDDARQRFLVRHAVDATSTDRATSICAHTMAGDDLLIVPDASKDPRFADFEIVKPAGGVRFYAGAPLVSEEGAPLGALCVTDASARPQGLDELQREGLAVLASAVMRRLQARRDELRADKAIADREDRFQMLADSIPDIAWSADSNGDFNYFNKRWSEYTGLPEGQFGHDQLREAFHPDDRDKWFETWRTSLENRTNYETQFRLKRRDGVYRWVLARGLPVASADDAQTQWFGTLTDIDDAENLARANDLLARELSHRIKNIFAVVSGLVMLSARRKPELSAFAEELNGKIRALGKAHDYVRPDGNAGSGKLTALLADLSEPYQEGDQRRVLISGDDVAIQARAATPLALIFHELATNAAKYGALSDDSGSVALQIAMSEEEVRLTWREQGTEVAKTDGQEGFGSRLLQMSVEQQLRGTMEREWHADGLEVRLSFPIDAICG